MLPGLSSVVSGVIDALLAEHSLIIVSRVLCLHQHHRLLLMIRPLLVVIRCFCIHVEEEVGVLGILYA